MSDVNLEGQCALCGQPAEHHCDQCGKPLCGAHRVVVEGGLIPLSRCAKCNLRNKIRESPLIRYWRWQNEVESFVWLIWFLVIAAIVLAAILYRALVGPVPGPR